MFYQSSKIILKNPETGEIIEPLLASDCTEEAEGNEPSEGTERHLMGGRQLRDRTKELARRRVLRAERKRRKEENEERDVYNLQNGIVDDSEEDIEDDLLTVVNPTFAKQARLLKKVTEQEKKLSRACEKFQTQLFSLQHGLDVVREGNMFDSFLDNFQRLVDASRSEQLLENKNVKLKNENARLRKQLQEMKQNSRDGRVATFSNVRPAKRHSDRYEEPSFVKRRWEDEQGTDQLMINMMKQDITTIPSSTDKGPTETKNQASIADSRPSSEMPDMSSEGPQEQWKAAQATHESVADQLTNVGHACAVEHGEEDELALEPNNSRFPTPPDSFRTGGGVENEQDDDSDHIKQEEAASEMEGDHEANATPDTDEDHYDEHNIGCTTGRTRRGNRRPDKSSIWAMSARTERRTATFDPVVRKKGCVPERRTRGRHPNFLKFDPAALGIADWKGDKRTKAYRKARQEALAKIGRRVSLAGTVLDSSDGDEGRDDTTSVDWEAVADEKMEREAEANAVAAEHAVAIDDDGDVQAAEIASLTNQKMREERIKRLVASKPQVVPEEQHVLNEDRRIRKREKVVNDAMDRLLEDDTDFSS